MSKRTLLSSLNPLRSLCLSLPLLALSFSTGCIIERGDKSPSDKDDDDDVVGTTTFSGVNSWGSSASNSAAVSTGSNSGTGSVTGTPSNSQGPQSSGSSSTGETTTIPSSEGVTNSGTPSDSGSASTSGSESTSSDTDTSTGAPSSLSLKLKVEGEKKADAVWRLRFNYLKADGNSAAGTMIDLEVGAAGEEFAVELQAPADSKLTEKGSALLVAYVYEDADKNDAFNPNRDTYVAALPVLIRYSRPVAGKVEWQQDKGGQLSNIEGSLSFKRLDNIDLNKIPTVAIGGKMSEVLEGTNGVASVAHSEYTGKTKKDDFRGLESKLPQAASAETWNVEFSRRLFGDRLTGSTIPGVGTHGFEYLIGFYNEYPSDFFRPGRSKVTSGVCTQDKTPVGGLYVTPRRNWITDPVGAYMAALSGIRPGWNVVNVQLDVTVQNGDRIRTLGADERRSLMISDECLITKE